MQDGIRSQSPLQPALRTGSTASVASRGGSLSKTLATRWGAVMSHQCAPMQLLACLVQPTKPVPTGIWATWGDDMQSDGLRLGCIHRPAPCLICN